MSDHGQTGKLPLWGTGPNSGYREAMPTVCSGPGMLHLCAAATPTLYLNCIGDKTIRALICKRLSRKLLGPFSQDQNLYHKVVRHATFIPSGSDMIPALS